MREKEIEKKLCMAVKKRGGLCLKWVSPSFDGVPDRLLFLPGRHFGMVEVKAPGGKPRRIQLARHKALERLGFKVYILDGEEQIGEILNEIQNTL